MLYEDSETVALIIKNVTEADAGKIQVVARNDLGACTSEVDLVIKGEPYPYLEGVMQRCGMMYSKRDNEFHLLAIYAF